MSRCRMEVPCYGLKLVLTMRQTEAAHGKWVLELYRDDIRNRRNVHVQVVAIVGGADEEPRFHGSDPGCHYPQHLVWLGSSCVQVPERSWRKLKEMCEQVKGEAP